MRRDIVLDWLAAQPLLAPAVGLVLGIALDAFHPVGLPLVLVLFAAGGVLLLARRCSSLGHLGVLLAATAVGMALHDLHFRRWPADHLVRYCSEEPTPVRLAGTVITSPAISPVATGRIEWFSQPQRTRFELEAEKVAGPSGDLAVSGLVAVVVHEPVLGVSAGDRVELFGTMFRPEVPRNPGQLDFALINRRRGVLVQVSCERAANIRVVDAGHSHHRWLAAVRRRARAAMLDHAYRGDEAGAQLLAAMVLGQRSAVSPEVNNAFVATGTVHYLSVSGAHLGMLASVVWLIGLLAGATRRTCAVWTMLVITAYAILAEPNAPVWRSALTGNLLCLSILLRRPVRSLNWLALAAIILLAVQPTQLFDPGFQLSFLTVVALLHLHLRLRRSAHDLWNRLLGRDDPLLMPAVQDMLNPPGRLRRIVRSAARVLAECTLLSMAAWMGSAPLAAYHFHRLPLWGWFDTVVALPFIWLTQMVGFVKPLASWLVPPSGHWVATPLAYLTDALIAVVIWLSRIPGSGLATPAVPGWLVVGACVVLVLWIVAERLQVSGHAVAVAALLLAVAAAWRLAPPAPGDTLRLRVLAVGHGAAHVVTLPNARTFVYDMGSMPPYDLEQWTVGPVLARDRVARIDAAVVSHANLDHFCGLPDLAEHRPVGWLFSSRYFFKDLFHNPCGTGVSPVELLCSKMDYQSARSAGARGRLVAEMCRLGVRPAVLARGDRLVGTGDVSMDVLWPPGSDTVLAEANDTSVVLRLQYAGRRILLCGDIETLAQQGLIASTDLKADVLVLPHHGSPKHLTPEFLRAVDPRICICSSGQQDSESPNGVRSMMAGRQYYNTADVGAVTVCISPTAIRVCCGPDETPVCTLSNRP